MTEAHAAQLNLAAVAIVLGFSFATLYRLDKSLPKEGRFLIHSYLCWVGAWSVWAVLWALEARQPAILPEASLKTTLLILSDVNTAFILLFYFGLTRGDDIKPTGYLILGLALAFAIATVDSMLIGVGGPLGRELHGRWAMALSMGAPILVGWACRLRYGGSLVLIVGVIYAVLQPPAQLVVLGDSSKQTLIAPEIAVSFLTILAMLKIIFGTAVVATVGHLPTTYGSLVTASSHRTAPIDNWWPALPWLLCTAGLIVVGVLAYWFSPEVFGPWFGRLATGLGVLGTLLKLYELAARGLDSAIEKRRANV